MSKAVSYFDWSLSLKHKSESDKEIFNSLGMSDNNFKDFIKKWKDKNLS